LGKKLIVKPLLTIETNRMDNTTNEDVLIRSRSTILDLLHDRGYNTTPYRTITGSDLVKFDLVKLVHNPEALRMELVARDDLEHMKGKKAIVEYEFGNIKQSVGSGDFIKKILSEPEEKKKSSEKLTNIDPTTTEIVILYLTKKFEEDLDSYDKGAYEAWDKHKLKIQFFPMFRLVNNPLKHVSQPRFEIVPHEQHTDLLKEWYCRTKTQLPIIKFHNDMAARCLGLLPMDIVKITSFSPTAGEYVKYRVCLP
jgi:DNA-directed RNA polymerase subunit H (RpoH/RPB5)